MDKDNPTPTLNPEYNKCLAKWAKQGYPSEPCCETCGADLTGQRVIEAGIGWICLTCFERGEHGCPADKREDFHSDG